MTRDYSYQQDAIKAICKKYTSSINSKTLLVIPTGGGKTLTAIRAVNEMLCMNLLQKTDVVYWVVHSVALKIQTQNVLDENVKWGKFLNHLEPCHPDLNNILKVKMLKDASDNHLTDNPKLIIIDEAHHSAALSYQTFIREEYGVLGLTATPTRNDDAELAYDEVVFSITTRELIRRNVIIKPTIHSIRTGAQIDISSLDNEGSSRFNFPQRNKFVAEKVFKSRHQYKKAILYVHTREHAIDLCNALRKFNERFPNDGYDHIGYILGGDSNSEGVTNEKYLDSFKKQRSALVVNCGVLTEGFDDPSINTVMMVVPTGSVIHYLQCIGRAIRTPSDGVAENAYVVEFEDDMPNIHYRIDNKWLFADISDQLEPEVLETDFSSVDDFKEKLERTSKQFHVKFDQNSIQGFNEEQLEECNILLYNSTDTVRQDAWKHILLRPDNFQSYSNIFNVLCNRAQEFCGKGINVNWLFDEKLKFEDPDQIFIHEFQRTDLFNAIEKAYLEKNKKNKVERLKYIIFNKINSLPSDFLLFIDDCSNKDELIHDFEQMTSKGAISLIKIPLVLGGFEGVYLDDQEQKFCLEYIENLKNIKTTGDWKRWQQEIYNQNNLLTAIPISPRHLSSLPLIIALNKTDFILNIAL